MAEMAADVLELNNESRGIDRLLVGTEEQEKGQEEDEENQEDKQEKRRVKMKKEIQKYTEGIRGRNRKKK